MRNYEIRRRSYLSFRKIAIASRVLERDPSECCCSMREMKPFAFLKQFRCYTTCIRGFIMRNSLVCPSVGRALFSPFDLAGSSQPHSRFLARSPLSSFSFKFGMSRLLSHQRGGKILLGKIHVRRMYMCGKPVNIYGLTSNKANGQL